jgi:hypothetical protein
MQILNLTQHAATEDQINAGVIDLSEQDILILKRQLTFNELPTKAEIMERAEAIAELAKTSSTATFAMIGGAGYLMPSLESALLAKGITPLHAFSQRISVEKQGENGEVIKSNVFKHVGFIGL